MLKRFPMKKTTKPTKSIGLQRETLRPITARTLAPDELPQVYGGTSIVAPSPDTSRRPYTATCPTFY
jgi:hypothetical protein